MLGRRRRSANRQSALSGTTPTRVSSSAGHRAATSTPCSGLYAQVRSGSRYPAGAGEKVPGGGLGAPSRRPAADQLRRAP